MIYTLYNPATGQIVSNLSINDSSLIDSNVGNTPYIEGNWDSRRYYIANGIPTLLPIKPVAFLQEYLFDWTSKTWIFDSDKTASLTRKYRDSLLNQTVDQMNPIWYASLTQEQQQELAAYRQALLDIPQQAGWPSAIEWPTKPSWV